MPPAPALPAPSGPRDFRPAVLDFIFTGLLFLAVGVGMPAMLVVMALELARTGMLWEDGVSMTVTLPLLVAACMLYAFHGLRKTLLEPGRADPPARNWLHLTPAQRGWLTDRNAFSTARAIRQWLLLALPLQLVVNAGLVLGYQRGGNIGLIDMVLPLLAQAGALAWLVRTHRRLRHLREPPPEAQWLQGVLVTHNRWDLTWRAPPRWSAALLRVCGWVCGAAALLATAGFLRVLVRPEFHVSGLLGVVLFGGFWCMALTIPWGLTLACRREARERRAALGYGTVTLQLDRASERPLVLDGVVHFDPPLPQAQRIGAWNERMPPNGAWTASLNTRTWDDLTHRYPDRETRLDVPLAIDADGARGRFVIVVRIDDPVPVQRVQSFIDITRAGAPYLRMRYEVPEEVLFPIEVAR